VVGFARTPIVLVLLLGACVKSQAVACGDLLCPEGSVCAKGNLCVSGSLATACNGRAEGATCTLSELGTGTCQNGLCITGRCGVQIVNGIEACDGADLGGKTCLDFGSNTAAGLTCTADCSLDTSGCNGICGDGHKGAGEDCDGNDFGGKTCTDFAPGGTANKYYASDMLACTNQCKFNSSGCATAGWCGDGHKQSVEECDGSDLGQPAGQPPPSCTDLGHPGAATPRVCDSTTCKFAETNCWCGLNGICPPQTPKCAFDGMTYSCTQ
jgi:hypothetical protein